MKSLKRIAIALAALSVFAFAQADGTPADKPAHPVSVTAKGTEVHTVLASIFEQAKKQYVLDPNLHFAVFLSLDGVEFQRALDIVCDLASIHADLEDGVYFVHPGKRAKPTPPTVTAKPAPPKPAPIVVTPPKPLGPLPVTVLTRHINTRLAKADIRAVFEEFARQSHVAIVVDPRVPTYKLDVFLLNTSLRYALNQVTQAAGLEWKLPQNHTIEIVPQEESRVEIVKS